MKKIYIEGLTAMPKGCNYCKFLIINATQETKNLCGLNYEFVKKSEERDKSCPLREEK